MGFVLIECWECKRLIPDTATACSHCGAPAATPSSSITSIPPLGNVAPVGSLAGREPSGPVKILTRAAPRPRSIAVAIIGAAVALGLVYAWRSGELNTWASDALAKSGTPGASKPSASPDRTVPSVRFDGQFIDDSHPNVGISTLTVTRGGVFNFVTTAGVSVQRLAAQFGHPAPSALRCTGRSTPGAAEDVTIALTCDDGSSLSGERFQFDEGSDSWRLYEDNNVFVLRRTRSDTQPGNVAMPSPRTDSLAPTIMTSSIVFRGKRVTILKPAIDGRDGLPVGAAVVCLDAGSIPECYTPPKSDPPYGTHRRASN